MSKTILNTKYYNQILDLVKGYLNQYQQTNAATYQFKLVSQGFNVNQTPYLLNRRENNPVIQFDIFTDQNFLLSQVTIDDEIKFSDELPVNDLTMHQMLTKFQTWLHWWYQNQTNFLDATFNRFQQWNQTCSQQLLTAQDTLRLAIVKNHDEDELIVLPIENDTKIALCVKMNDAHYEMVLSLDGFGNVDLNAKLETPATNQFDYENWLTSYNLCHVFNQIVNQQRKISIL